jgi:hypothetical protein
MNYSELLDDNIVYDNLNTEAVYSYSHKIAKRVLILSVFFFVFAIVCTPITMEAFNKMGRISDISIPYVLAAVFTQLGCFFLAVRLFIYQKNIRKKQDWHLIFESKYKVWRALAIVFILSLSSISYLLILVNGL